MAADAASTCPECGSDDVEFDTVQALTYCSGCGYVLDTVHLDGRSTSTRENPSGVLVRADDDGRMAGAFGLQTGGASHLYMKRSRAQVQSKLRSLCGVMAVPPQAQAEAVALLEQLLPKLHGQGKGPIKRLAAVVLYTAGPSERLAAVALYIAARLHQLPLTIVDVSAAVKTSTQQFGRLFKLALRTLQLELPLTSPGVFIHAAVQKACPDKHQRAAVAQEAEVLQGWLARHQLHGTPLLRCACALAITLESRAMKPKAVSQALHVSEAHLKQRVRVAKAALLAAAASLPWAASITPRNVALHQQAILRLAPATDAATMKSASVAAANPERAMRSALSDNSACGVLVTGARP